MNYIHHLPGRLRVRSANLKQETKALAVKNRLSMLPGVENVRTNLVTGSAIIHYHPSMIAEDDILAKVSEITGAASPAGTLADTPILYRQRITRRVNPATQQALNRAFKSAGMYLLEKAVERSLTSLIVALV